ncbi:50S ribosomal protein L24 [Candidatus Saccharibacteria bacterium]|nr:50S ribosomal protein L24 [Candidatus Saccharibacteria bacterium]
MKLRLKDKVMVLSGRDKGKTGEVIAVLPKDNKVVVEGINIVKRHTKPTTQNPRGGIVELTRPLEVSKLAVLDPKSGKIARVAYQIDKQGKKERIFKVSKFSNPKPKKATPKTEKKS